MKLHLWGTDFRRSPAELRSRLFIPLEKRAARVRGLLDLGFRDLVYFPTCHRVEFYTTAPDYFASTRGLWLKLLRELDLPPDAFYQGYYLEGKSALRHLLRVACSLESLVVGESQVLGQLKESVAWTRKADLPLDPSLDQSFQFCFQTAKKVRTQTEIGRKPVSVATVGLARLMELESQFPLRDAVVVGRSPITVSILQWLLENRPDCPITWVNRTLETLHSFPESKRVTLLSLDRFLREPLQFSHLFTSTSRGEPVFRAGFFEKLTGSSRLFFDFAQPPDIETGDALTRAGRRIGMEDLVDQAHRGSVKQASIEEAERLIDDSLRDYCQESKEAPLMKKFTEASGLFRGQLENELGRFELEFPETDRPKARELAERLTKKNWHLSRECLREALRSVVEPDEQVPVV